MSATPPAPEPVQPEKKVLGVTLGDAVKVALGLAVGLALSAFGVWLNSSSPRLTFEVSTPVLFHGEKTKFGIITLTVTNDGSREAENVVCTFSTSGAKAPEIKVTPEHLKATTSIKNDIATITVASLNPGEKFSVVTHTPDVLPDKPEVNVRAKGVNGTERNAASPSSASSSAPWWQNILLMTAPMLLITLTPLLWVLERFFQQLLEERKQRKQDERERRLKDDEQGLK